MFGAAMINESGFGKNTAGTFWAVVGGLSALAQLSGFMWERHFAVISVSQSRIFRGKADSAKVAFGYGLESIRKT